ncbi:MAG: hypothetical protein LBM62_03130, partial [Mediterranea sp.]|nr:hypothetical protein [Mediterranea sp.]
DKIVQRGDTVSYNIAGFAQSQDRSIGDVLAKMPGISVADNGQISYNGSAVSKFYIEGSDLFGGKYTIATQNLSYKDVAKVEVLENHQSVKALSSRAGTETALNLKLKEDAKARWTGSLKAAGSIRPDTWCVEAFAANFSARFQNANTFKSNNNGADITAENRSLTIADLVEMIDSQGSELSSLLTIVPTVTTDVADSRLRFNRTHIFNTSHLWKRSDNHTLKAQITYTDHHNDYRQSVENSYFLPDSTLTKATSESSSVVNRNLQATLTSETNKESFYLLNETKYATDWKQIYQSIQGDYANNQEAQVTTGSVGNRLKFIKKIGNHSLTLSSFNSYAYLPEQYSLTDSRQKQQTSRKSNFFSKTGASYTHHLKRWFFTWNAALGGASYHISSRLDGIQSDTLFRNEMTVGYFSFTMKPEISYEHSRVKAALRIPAAFYRYNATGRQTRNVLFANPDLYIRWKMTSYLSLFANAAWGSSPSDNSYSYLSPVMSNYRSTATGFLNFKGKLERRAGIRLGYSYPVEMLFAHISASGSVENTGRATTKQVNDGYVNYVYTPGNDTYRLWFLNGSISKGLNFINGTAEIGSSFQSHEMPLVQNGVAEDFEFGVFNLTAQISAVPAPECNLNYKVTYAKNFMNATGFKSSNQHLAQRLVCNLFPGTRLSLKIVGEHYFTRFSSGDTKNTFLADVEVVYSYKQWEVFASLSNIFNRKEYAYTTYSDLSSTSIRYRLRPRTLLVGASWKF